MCDALYIDLKIHNKPVIYDPGHTTMCVNVAPLVWLEVKSVTRCETNTFNLCGGVLIQPSTTVESVQENTDSGGMSRSFAP